MRVNVVAAVIDGVARCAEKHVTDLHAAQVRRAALADFPDVEAALLGLELKKFPERRILGPRGGDAQRGETLVFPVLRVGEEPRDHVHGEDIGDLVFRVVAHQDAGERAVADHRQGEAARRALHGRLHQVGQETLARQETLRHIHGLQRAVGQQGGAVVLHLKNAERIADHRRCRESERLGILEKRVAVVIGFHGEQGEVRLIIHRQDFRLRRARTVG